jgi:response regulator RpfG family c-di-GMP phosphodiesterase
MYCYAVAKALRLSAKDKEKAFYAGLLHDVSKAEGAFEILKSIEDDFTNEEKSDIQQQVLHSSKIVNSVDGLEYLYETIKHYHEHWDGTGFPDKLKGEAIPLISRVVFIACSYHIMRLEQHMTHDKAIAELRKQSGIKFDPKMIEPFIDIIEKEELF